MELKGKRIIVTGCASGMGAATVRAYVKAGAQVVGMDISDDTGRAVCAEAAADGPGEIVYVSVDVADGGRVEAAFAEADDFLGGLDALAHPAAIHAPSKAGDVTIDDWDRMFAVNVRGTVLTNQAAYHRLKVAGGGAIVNFGSISGQRAEPEAAAYSASKGAVHAWTRTAAGAWGADGVRVNAVLPAIRTPMFQASWDRATDEERTEKFWRNIHSIALGQEYGDPDRDLGPVMVFLASDASRFITGQLIPVDGGQGNVR
ncbi:MAG: SDR family oxidoreductase [Acidimicrobiia bacterium]|nr:SDR family oxidoreductase [Acidimicrobiia bacterium]MYB09564.1 SDR family oxidoreductase [Acidimicrobiia bacterium]MYE74668.1 SDR family oxidoreductase [Acidimicrobiia bacterium]MYG58791.1 SDR family oxidoreductase [Acidimicrobiia bacterium]MYH96156.1 SDR family oxidoreductase [Acidimicrobiia bacterium]